MRRSLLLFLPCFFYLFSPNDAFLFDNQFRRGMYARSPRYVSATNRTRRCLKKVSKETNSSKKTNSSDPFTPEDERDERGDKHGSLRETLDEMVMLPRGMLLF